MDIRLNHVVAVARGGSFTAAAKMIGVSQSAVTKGVADMERQLGYALFHRTARGALLTEKGRDFAERAARLLDDTRELLKGEIDQTDAFAGVLRIGVCPGSVEWRLIDPIIALQRRHPKIRFDVSGSSFERMVQQLRNGGVDVVVGFDAAFREWPEFDRAPIAELRSEMFVRNEHPLLAQMPITTDMLAEYDFVSPSDSRPYGSVIRGLYETRGIDWRKRLHVIDYFPLVQRIVANSNAIGVVAVSYAASPSFRQRFKTLELIDRDSFELGKAAPMCCATRARWDPSPAARAFIRAVQSDTRLE
jgi:DNA-binding transcriptional LysR family regulator